MMEGAALRLHLLVFLFISVSSAPVTKTQNVDIYSFHIKSTVNSRYATTLITSRVANKLNESQEIQFEVKIPKNAFISKFTMTIEGKMYDGVVREKAEAQQQYSEAVSRGQSAGLIRTVGRTLEDFKTSVTVAALSKVTFELTYEELLKRRLGKYQLLIHVQPMQIVSDFKIDVEIKEKTGISFLDVEGDLSTNELADAIKTTTADKQAWVTFYPTREQQTKCKTCGKDGLNGNLLLTYDVERQNPNGEMMVLKGYFVHLFAPSDIPRMPKNVVFIIDRSGSMHGRKIAQTRLALLRILGDLADNDHFGLITFDSQIEQWRPELVKASEENLQHAKSFVRKITDRGATDINAAVLAGVNMIQRQPQDTHASILILLTDGDPTAGETNTERILGNVRKAIGSKFPLYCLGFGYDVNFDFLTKMSLENNGRARRIYEDSDADLQLQGFYDEVAIPLLSDIELKYTGVSNLTQTSFNLYFNGSEIVVSGQITDNGVESVTTEVIATSKGRKVSYNNAVAAKDVDSPEPENYMERLWAYITVKQLLDRQVLLKDQEKEDEKKEALRLSLKYQFVTPLTSMVVTKPQEGEVEVADKPKEGEAPHRPPVHAGPRYTGVLPGLPGRPGYHGSYGSRNVQLFLPFRPVPAHPKGEAGKPGRYPAFVYPARRPPLRNRDQDEDHAAGVSVSSDYSDMDFEMDLHPTQHVIVSAPAVGSNRFVLPADGQSRPLCFDVPLPHKLRLLQDSSSEFSMNGESVASVRGFRQIVIHYKTHHRLAVNTDSISYRDPRSGLEYRWGQEHPPLDAESVSLIVREREVDVTMGNIRLVIARHGRDGDAFLWPAVRQRPTGGSVTGVLGKAKISYEEIQGSNPPALNMMNKTVTATLDDVTDYSLPAAADVRCWLVSFQAVMDGEISDFTVTQL